jgi:hypothetical protein
MRTRAKLNALSICVICLALICIGNTAVHAAPTLTAGALTPGEATSNSMYQFSALYSCIPEGQYPDFLKLYIDGVEQKVWYKPQLAAFDQPTGTVATTGVRFYFRVSGGMDTATSSFGPNSLFDNYNGWPLGTYDWKKVFYAPWISSWGDGTPLHHVWMIAGQATVVDGSGTLTTTPLQVTGDGPTVHDSFSNHGNPSVWRYGGNSGDRDSLSGFPVGYPLHNLEDPRFPDPLQVTANTIDPPEVQFPDEGTSTSTYKFQVGYHNADSTEPMAWVVPGGDPWNTAMGSPDYYESGIMVYLRNLDMPNDYWLGSFHGHHMYKADPSLPANDHTYVLNVVPAGNSLVGTTNSHWRTTWGWTSSTQHYYEALPPGRYEYYFACSDDNFQAFGVDKGLVWQYLDAPSPRLPTAPAPNDRLFGRLGINYTTDGQYGYVDKRTYMPGSWVNGYPYDSWAGSSVDPLSGNINNWPVSYKAYSYPEVDPGLYQVGGSPTSNSGLAGGARFLGTLSPYKRAVVPSIPDAPGYGMYRLWAESAGGTAQDTYTFQVNYWQSAAATDAGDMPSYIRLYVKNSWNPDDTTVNWKSYDMQPVSQPVDPEKYKTGVIFYVTLDGNTLGYGPHCYYFQAADQTWEDTRYLTQYGTKMTVGSKVVRYPRRPDTVKYDGAYFYDGLLPSKSPIATEDIGMPVDNDVINGPYINRKPEFPKIQNAMGQLVDSWSVTPQSGTSGNEFVYKVLYRDPDNQRPYTPYIIIEIDDQGDTFKGSMVRSPESSVPGNSTALYSTGVWYEFHTSSAPGLRLEPGSRRYRFEFTDDWGRQTNQDDRIAGETVTAPQGGAGWIGGPYVSSNRAPRLSMGSVTSADQTSNEATTWNYTVTYSDLDNDPPAYILVLIGRQDTPGGTIVWDSGNAMVATLPSDSVYSDGKTYKYSTQLPGNNDQPIKYYHCFVASDGITPAEYDSVVSPSSGMVWTAPKPLTSVGGSTVYYDFGHKPLVTDVPPSSPLMGGAVYSNPLIYGQTLVNGVPTNTLLTSGPGYTLNGRDGIVSIGQATAPITAKYWFGTEPGSTGPVAVTGNHPPTLQLGQVIPLTGTSSTQFAYTVTYTDLDGQAPQFVNAVIDNVRHPMVNIRNSTTYKNGVEYQCTATLSTGTHQFYFESSDGGTLVVFDGDLSNSAVDPIEGPYVNDRPTITSAGISPSGVVDQGQPITYTLTVNDKDNDLPLDGYPVVYIDPVYRTVPDPTDPTKQIQVETDWTGSISAVSGNTVMDNTQNWTVDQFKGMPVSINDQSGNSIVFKIGSNTATALTLVATPDDVEGTGGQGGVVVGSQYSIGKLTMQKQDPADMIFSDGVTYEAKVPSLGVGTVAHPSHSARFKVIVNEQTRPGVYVQTTLRAGTNGDLGGPTVQALAPAGNTAPVLTNGASTPRTGTAVTPFRFAVTYTDANGNPPQLTHDGVTGYIQMVIEETPGNWKTYDLDTDAPAPNYTVGVEFSRALTGLALGPHNYYFQASDGWMSTKFPSSGNLTVFVSRPPTLVEGSVSPVTGNIGHVFEYKVKYKDPDNDPPAFIKLVIDDGTPIDIGVPTPGADYVSGVVYSYPLLKGTLDERLHNFYFICSDGNGYAWYDQDVRDQEAAHNADPRKNSVNDTPSSPVRRIDGPSVHSNDPSKLLNGGVLPGIGFDPDVYTYSVTYQDPNGDLPEYVECYIDDPNPLAPNVARAYKMIKDPSQDDFVAGVRYTLSKTGLATGSHTFYFKSSDWLTTAYYPSDIAGNPGTPISGPSVSTRGTATINLTVPSSITIGDSVSVTGSVVGYAGVSLTGIPVQIKITKPDGTVITPQTTVTTNGSGQFTYPEGSTPWKPTVTGAWKIQASWVGSTQYLLSTSGEKSIPVLGPSYTVNGLDMISLPVQPLSSFPDGALGTVPGFALAKWLPTKVDYKMYTLLSGVGRTDYDFPPMAPGQAYWIRTLVPKTIAPTGTLIDPTSDYLVSLGVGWNQIGCPFTVECQWSALKVRRTINGVVQELSLAAAAANDWVKEYGWTYDASIGNYKLVDATRAGADRTMRPWRGYWVKANMYCTLVIPAPSRSRGDSNAAKASALTADAMRSSSAPKWQVQMIAKNGDLKDECNYLGASRLKDEHIESPTCFQNYVDLYFTDKKGGMYASDLRGELGPGDEWQIVVTTDKSGEIELTWAGLENMPSGIRLVLTDEDGKNTQIVPGGSYKFTAGEGVTTKTFQIEVKKS